MATQTITRQPSDTLLRLLDEELRFDPSFRRHYSNHLAMALVALDQMGAHPARLQAVFDDHARGESEPRTDPDELAERLREIERDGIDETVRHRVPQLATGPSSQLFHPMIRLAYGLESGHAGQVAAALLDWERRFQPASPSTDSDVSVDDVATYAVAAHAAAEDFFTLHFVTGARALRVVSSRVDDGAARQLATHALGHMAQVYAGLGAPPPADAHQLDELRRAPVPDRSAIAEHAVASPDPHVIKLADVALAEEERTGDPLYRYLAARWMRLT